MSVAQSLFFSPQVVFSPSKYSNKIETPLFGGFEKCKLSKSRSRSGKVGVNFNGYPYFTAPRHPLESQLPSLEADSGSHGEGVGIDSFFEGKNIFITGGTGLLGKALVEKLLRSTSVEKIYVLVKASDKEAAIQRISKEIVNSELFQCLREKHGSTYEEFVKSKLIAVVGNICEPNIGMDMNSANKIMEEVDVIVESAASTTLNDRYDFLLDINVNAPLRLMRFAKKCKNLKLFVHMSTAYVNGTREGIIYEKPLIMGENGRNSEDSSSLFPLDLTDEMNLAMKACSASDNNQDSNKELKRLGLERAAYHGWYNAYHMTKAMGEIYVLVKASDKEAAIERISKEIINSELFQCLREKHGSTYEEFVKSKLIAVVGNICEPNIGMDMNSANKIMEEVDVIVESAASTTLNDRYDFLLDINVNAPLRLMRFAKKCKNLKLFVHMSTAYVNGTREGIIYEKALIMGENGRDSEDSPSLFPLDLTDEMNLAMKACSASDNNQDSNKELKRLGLERAAYHGWYNAYHMTKAMGEMALNEIRQQIPLLILRPAIIESCYKEPLPGWIQGNRMYDPVIISYGKGQLPAYLADPDLHTDIVPVDMVANTTIAAIAKHGAARKPELNVYHVATDFVNPLRFSEMFEYFYEHFRVNPLVESGSMKKMKLFKEFSNLSQYIRDQTMEKSGNINGVEGKIGRQQKARVAYAEQLCKMYEFIGFFKARFHTGNTRKLLEEMSEEEKAVFEIDATKIDWKKYFVDIHIPGLRKHVVSGTRLSV